MIECKPKSFKCNGESVKIYMESDDPNGEPAIILPVWLIQQICESIFDVNIMGQKFKSRTSEDN